MSAPSYTMLDAEIQIAVKAGENPLYASAVHREVRALELSTGRNGARILDGRLQALRRAGAIHYLKGKWRPGPTS